MESKVEQKVIFVRQWLINMENVITQVEFENFRRILYLSMIDAFAQHDANYSRHNVQGQFAAFISKYGIHRWKFLNDICPVTLFNYYSDKYDIAIKLTPHQIYTVDDVVLKSEGDRLAEVLLRCGIPLKEIKKHTYANLVYAMRNKLTHELTIPGAPIDMREDEPNQIPNISQGMDTWNLYIPEMFLHDLLIETTSHYLDECSANNIEPFANNSYSRKFRIAWYD